MKSTIKRHSILCIYRIFKPYDMHGNVFKWCLDWYDPDYGCSNKDISDPVGASMGSYLVERGGGCGNFARNCCSAYRYYGYPSTANGDIGFRVCLSACRSVSSRK